MFQAIFFLVFAAIMSLATGHDIGQASNKQWTYAYEAFANAMGYDPNNQHWTVAYETFVNATAVAAPAITTSDVTPMTGWGVFFPLVWLWRTLPCWNTLFVILLIIAGLIWSPRGSHIVEALINALQACTELLKFIIPNPIDINRVQKAQDALSLAQHHLSVVERIANSEFELRKAADHDRMELLQKLEAAHAANEGLNYTVRKLQRPLDFQTLQLRIRELNQQLYAATKDVNDKMEVAKAPLHREIDALKKFINDKEESIELCHRSTAGLEATGKDIQKQAKLDKNMIAGLKRINLELRQEIKQLQNQSVEMTKEANLMIASRDSQLGTVDTTKELLQMEIRQLQDQVIHITNEATSMITTRDIQLGTFDAVKAQLHEEIKQLQNQITYITVEAGSMIEYRDHRLKKFDAVIDLLHWMVGEFDHFEVAMTFAALASQAEIELEELDIDPQKFKVLADFVEKEIEPTAAQRYFRRDHDKGRIPAQ